MRFLLILSTFAATYPIAAQGLDSTLRIWNGERGGGATVTDNSVASRSATLGSFTGITAAQSDYGTLRASAFGSNTAGTEYAYAQASASFNDTLTITGGSGFGYLLMDYTVSGDITGTGDGSRLANLLWNNLPNGVPSGLTPGTDDLVTGVFPIEFTYGISFAIFGQLFANVLFPSGGTGTSNVDFSSTATLTKLTVRNNGGEIVNGLTVTSASGHAYPSPVPEPATLVVLGLGALSLKRRQRR